MMVFIYEKRDDALWYMMIKLLSHTTELMERMEKVIEFIVQRVIKVLGLWAATMELQGWGGYGHGFSS